MEASLSGTLTADKVKFLINPLKDLVKFNTLKVVLEFQDDKTLKINGVNDSSLIISRVEFDSFLFQNFDFKGYFEYGIYDLSEFINLLSVFDDGFDINWATELLSINKEASFLDYYGSEIKKIQRGPEGELAFEPLSSMTWKTADFKQFTKAASKIQKDYVILQGKDNIITLSVTDKDIRTNAFTSKVTIDKHIEKPFKVILNKTAFLEIIGSSIKEYELTVYDPFISFTGSCDTHKATYFLAATAK